MTVIDIRPILAERCYQRRLADTERLVTGVQAGDRPAFRAFGRALLETQEESKQWAIQEKVDLDKDTTSRLRSDKRIKTYHFHLVADEDSYRHHLQSIHRISQSRGITIVVHTSYLSDISETNGVKSAHYEPYSFIIRPTNTREQISALIEFLYEKESIVSDRRHGSVKSEYFNASRWEAIVKDFPGFEYRPLRIVEPKLEDLKK